MEVVWPVELPVVSAIVGHLVLGLQHEFVRDTSITTMAKLIYEATGGLEHVHITRTSCYSATWVNCQKGSYFLIGCRLEVGIIEGFTKGIVVGG